MFKQILELNSNAAKNFLDLNASIAKGSMNAMAEPFRDRLDDSDLPFDLELAGGFGGAEFWEDEGDADKAAILLPGLTEDSKAMRPLGGKMVENGHNGDEVYALTFDSMYPGLEDGAEQLNEMVEEVKEYTGVGEVDLIGYSMGGTIPIQYMDEYGAEDIDKLVSIVPADGGSYWNDYFRSTGLPHIEEISNASAEDGKLDQINQEYDAEIIKILGGHDSLYPFQDPEDGCPADRVEVLDSGHASIRRSDELWDEIYQVMCG